MCVCVCVCVCVCMIYFRLVVCKAWWWLSTVETCCHEIIYTIIYVFDWNIYIVPTCSGNSFTVQSLSSSKHRPIMTTAMSVCKQTWQWPLWCMLALDTFPLWNTCANLAILQYGAAQSSMLCEALHGAPLNFCHEELLFSCTNNIPLYRLPFANKVTNTGCLHMKCMYTPVHTHHQTITFISTYFIPPKVYAPLSVLPKFCTTTPLPNGGGGGKKKQK